MKKEISHSELVEFLLNPDSYPHKPKSVEHLQTHSSDVFIATPYVYKVKKPVNLGFLDFSTLEKRKYYCKKEIGLNRRLCGDTYLGVEEISLGNDGLTFGEGDWVVEYAVKMRQLPEKYFLKNLLKEGEVGFEDFLRVVERLTEFYNSQSSESRISDFGRPDRIRVNTDENFSRSKRFVGGTISQAAYDAIKFYNDLFFDRKSHVFLESVERGRIKDCHGDLHLEHINLRPEGLCIYDCIEFNDRFRYVDIASDVAFLAMDLDYNGYREFADFVISEVSKRTEDEGIFRVVDFYKCYRAYVRGKVESIKGEEAEVSEEEKGVSREKARRYFKLALRYALFGSKPVFVVVFGLIGTGKSTLADMLSTELSCEVVSSDAVRKEITSVGRNERRYEGFDEGIYSEDTTDATYREMVDRAKREVTSGKTVVLDASFSKRKYRELVREEAEALGIPSYFVEVKASDEVVRERLIEREKRGTSVSDGRWEIFERFKEGFERPDELPESSRVVVSTNGTLEESLGKAMREITFGRLK